MSEKTWYFDKRGSRFTAYLTQFFEEWGIGLSFSCYSQFLHLEASILFWHLVVSFYYGRRDEMAS
jgi:hypothetical protein